jgi:phosphotransferase system enzyme I (PtsI)
MISTVEELLDAKLALEEAMVELDERGEFYDTDIEVGMMVEVPVAAMMADVFAREVDFLIIGTTDLVQLMSAVDRNNEHIFELYDMYHPGLLRMIRYIVAEAHKEGTWVSVTGDLANNEILLPFFTAIGVDQICMSPTLITKARWVASKTNKAMWEEEINHLINMSSGNEIKHYLEKRYYEEFVWT